MLNTRNLVDVDSIASFEDIITELTKLKVTLREDQVKQFLVFNNAYLVVTSDIKQAAEAGHFDNPKFIEQFTVRFAHYYFQAINQTAQHAEMPEAWRALGKAGRKKAMPTFILLLMGANAHINHDLALALAKLMEHETTDDLLKDVVKIDTVIMKSGKEIITTFREPSTFLDVLKRRCSFLYYRPTMYMIRFWRVRAWARYRAIRKHGPEGSNYAEGSIKIAKRYLALGEYISRVS